MKGKKTKWLDEIEIGELFYFIFILFLFGYVTVPISLQL